MIELRVQDVVGLTLRGARFQPSGQPAVPLQAWYLLGEVRKRGWLKNRAEFCLAWPLLKTLEWLPLTPARWFSSAVGRLLYLTTPDRKAVAYRNLSLALPETSDARRRQVVRGAYDNLGRVLLAVARLPRLNPTNIREWIAYEGFEHYDSAIKKGRGVLFLTAHLGNWELSAVAHALFGNPMHVMVRPLDNPLLDRLLESHRTHCGNRTIRKQEFGRGILRALRDNESVGILFDQNISDEPGWFVDFFGVKASASPGFAKVAMRTNATVIPGIAAWKARERRYVLKFYPPLEMISTGDEASDLIVNTQRCHSAIERMVRDYPEQWLWMHRRWKIRPDGEPSLY